MDLSVIIVTRNTVEEVCAAIHSVYAGGESVSKEVIVVDNGSRDGTSRVIEKEYPEVRLLTLDRNAGYARAVNLGAAGAKGEFLLLLNSDARLDPGALEIALKEMRSRSRSGIAGAQLLNEDGSPQNSIANFPGLATELLNKSLLRRLFPRRFPGKERHYTEPITVETVVGAFFLVRRCLWDELGGLDERFFFFFEETDFCLQARKRGWDVLHLPSVRVWHQQGKSANKQSAAARIEYWRSRYAYFRKNHPAGTVALLRIGLQFRLLGDLAGALLLTGLTLGQSARWRERLRVRGAVLAWHARGCPETGGLPR